MTPPPYIRLRLGLKPVVGNAYHHHDANHRKVALVEGSAPRLRVRVRVRVRGRVRARVSDRCRVRVRITRTGPDPCVVVDTSGRGSNSIQDGRFVKMFGGEGWLCFRVDIGIALPLESVSQSGGQLGGNHLVIVPSYM